MKNSHDLLYYMTYCISCSRTSAKPMLKQHVGKNNSHDLLVVLTLMRTRCGNMLEKTWGCKDVVSTTWVVETTLQCCFFQHVFFHKGIVLV